MSIQKNITSKTSRLFFIVGNSRSGTTLVSRILKRHGAVHVLNETHFMEEFGSERRDFAFLTQNQQYRLVNTLLTIQRKDYYRKSEYEEYTQDAQTILTAFQQQATHDFPALLLAFFRFEAARLGKSHCGDQTPRHVFYIKELAEIFPDARFIHMIRDPRAVLLSQKKKWRAGRKRGQPFFEVLRTRLNYHPITTAVIWKKSIQAGLNTEKIIPATRMQTFFFEHLVQRPEATVKTLCAFLSLDFSTDMLAVDVEMSSSVELEGATGVSRSVAERWREGLSRTEIFLCETCAGGTMHELGYERTRSRPNPVLLIGYMFALPFQLTIALLFNLGRMGNPIRYISKRLCG